MNKNILPRFTLLCPGPVNVSSQVAGAYSQCALSHREGSFTTLLREVQRDLLFVADVQRPEEHTALLLTGSGTAANEAVLASTVKVDEPVLVLSNGEFGERLAAISNVYNHTEVIESEWGADLDLIRLEKLLARGRFGLVAMVHHETSTGLLNPVEEVGRLCKRYQTPFFVDAVSSFSADPISLQNGNITFLSTSSGKAIAGYPGLSFVLGKHDSFSQLANYPVRNHYLNLHNHYLFSEQFGQTPNTPAIPLIAAVKSALQEIMNEGLEQRYSRLSMLAAYIRRQLEERELYKPVKKAQSVVLTNVHLPEGVSFADLQQWLQKKGFVIYDTKGPLTSHCFQVSTIGDLGINDIDRFLSALDSYTESRIILEKDKLVNFM